MLVQHSDAHSGRSRPDLRRRGILGALVGGATALWAGFVPGFGRHDALIAESATLTEVWIDFDFPKGGMPLRRVVVNNRAIGKVTAWNGRRFGLVPAVPDSKNRVDLSIFDLSHQASPNVCIPKLLKKLTLPVRGEMVSLDLADDQGFRLKISAVKTRQVAAGLDVPTTAILDGQAFDCGIDCCVHCEDDPPGHDTCGSAVCCNIPCGASCGMCVDPGGNTDVCDPPPL